ncbi:MAG: hypothetical protein WEA58_12460 [Balneolaceae bacterium]
MNSFEYLIPLVSVLVGLAVADLATSFHRLLRARDRVEWDWLPLATALLAAIVVLKFWWSFYMFQNETSYKVLIGFVPVAITLVLLFLINAAVLPDKVPEKGIDLRVFYESNSSYFWILFATYIFVDIAQLFGNQLMSGLDLISALKESIPNLILISLVISLAFIRKRLFHTVVVIVLIVLFITQWYDISLGSV